MENRQRSKTIFRRGVVVLTALALISCCFVGSTLGRYVTKKEGSFDSGVALWKITEEVKAGEGSVDVNLNKISPSRSSAKITLDSNNQDTITPENRRSKQLTNITVNNITVNNITVNIKNEGDVNAYVMLTLGEVFGYQYVLGTDGKIQMDGGSRAVSDNAYTFKTDEDPDEPNIPTEDEWKAIFTATWGTVQIIPLTEDGQQGTPENATAETSGDYIGMYLVEPEETLSVAVTIKWNTDLATDTDFEKDVAGCIDADYRDTWIGENIGKISLAYSWYAVQGSEMPAEDNTP